MSDKRQFGRMTIGDRLRWLIEHRKYRQVELAEKIGITQSAISNLVTDSSRKPSAPTLLKLASALDASPDWIITGEGDPFGSTQAPRSDEQRLLAIYRSLSPKSQRVLLATAAAMQQE